MQALLYGQPLWLLHPITQTKPSQTSPLRQSSSLRHSGLHTPVTTSHLSLLKQPSLEEQTGWHAASWQTSPIGQSRFSRQGWAGVLTQATVNKWNHNINKWNAHIENNVIELTFFYLLLAVGFGTKPCEQEQLGRWFATLQSALGPHGLAEHGFVHLLLTHCSLAEQSSSEWQPKVHILWRQMWPRKQSLSTRQVTKIIDILVRQLFKDTLVVNL